MNTIILYLHAVRIQMKSRMQYPVSFILQTMAQLVMQSGELLAVLLMINRFGGLKEWNGGELLVFFGIMSLAFYLTEIFGRGLTGAFPRMVRAGTLDTILLRPRGILTQVFCEDVDPRRIGCIAVGLTALIIGCRNAKLVWTFGKAIVLAEALVFGGMLILGLFLIEAIMCIFSVKSLEMVNALTYGGRSACQYPIDIYPRPFQLIFSVIAPFSMTLHVPAAYILDKPLFGWPAWTAFVCPLAGAATFTIMFFIFRIAIRHYRSTGN